MKKPGYVDVDELQARTSLEDAAAMCGARLDAKPSGSEVRIDCPFGCPGDHSGRREISVSVDNPQKVFYCHAYQCQLRGNMLTLMHGWKTGTRPAGDKLKGAEFNAVKQILAAGSSTTPTVSTSSPAAPSGETQPAGERKPEPTAAPCIPLEDSPEEAVRALATIDEKFVTDVATMSPHAASYVRRHPALSSESMRKWRTGYLAMDGGGDKRGWSLRGHIVYPVLSEDGKVLAWIGRDPSYEEKEREFLALLPAEREKRKAPYKHKVPAGFARGSHLFGQQASRLREPGYREFIAEHGIVVVEGFNDVMGLDNLGIPAVGLMSNRMTDEQAGKVERWARLIGVGRVTLMFDCDPPGMEGAKEALWLLAERRLDVRLAWTNKRDGGIHAGRQPESVRADELAGLWPAS